MKRIVLDASAVMTFFLGRPGAEKVQEILVAASEGKGQLFMSVVNWGEFYYSIWREHGPEIAARKLAEIVQLPIEIVPADTAQTKLSAEFKIQHKLPYADSFAAALATEKSGEVVTSDKHFHQVEDIVTIHWIQ